MWFSRQRRSNRRLERSTVLDVKLRSSVARAARVRWGLGLVTVGLGTLFGLYLLWRSGEWALNRFLYENEAFAIQQIQVQTDGAISADQIRRWAGVRDGQNLLALDLARVRRDLELVPVIKTAAVERVLPHGLRLRVVEREPLAEVYVPRPRAAGGYDMTVYYLDEEGCVMLPLAARQRAVPLSQPLERYPVIAGLDFNQLQPGRRLESPQLQAALQLILAFDRSPMVGIDDLQRIDVSAPETLQVRTGQGGELTFSVRDLDRQLRRWREIHDLAQRSHKGLAWLDLAVSNNIPVRWLEAGALPPGGPGDLKPPRAKKKHV